MPERGTLNGGKPAVSAREWTVTLPSLTTGSGAASLGDQQRGGAELAESVRLPTIRSTGPLSARGATEHMREVEDAAREAMWGRLSNVRVSELNRHRQLQKDLAALRLSEYFDDRGSPRFRRLGLIVAAKQEPSVQDSFGSKGLDTNPHVRKPQNARACMLAMSALEKDIDLRVQRGAKLAEGISETERLQAGDVRRRQLEVLFGEMPNFERYMPPGVQARDLQPNEDPTKLQEMKERRLIETANHNLSDTAFRMGFLMKFLFSRSEALVLSRIAGLWATAARGRACPPVGMDRPSFCRMLLDLGLVDQVKVPLFWAVSLFDEAAHYIRCLPTLEVQLAAAAPFVPIASRWHVVLILDVICRQHFNHKTKGAFIGSLLQIARHRLPHRVIEESGLRDEIFARLAEGREVSSRDSFTLQPAAYSGGGGGRGNGPEADGSSEAAAVGADSAGESADDTDGGGSMLLSPSSARRRPTTPWHRYLGKPAEPEDIQAEELANDFVVRCMLVEPEVLHIVAQYRDLFQHLHASYAEEKDNLSYVELHQLFRDFHLTPQIVPPCLLQTLYESAECVDLLPLEPTPPGSPNVASRKSNSVASSVAAMSGPLIGLRKRTQKNRASAQQGNSRSTPSPSSPEPGSTETMRKQRSTRSDKEGRSGVGSSSARSRAPSETSAEPATPRRFDGGGAAASPPPEAARRLRRPSIASPVMPVAEESVFEYSEDLVSERGSVASVADSSDTGSVATAIVTGKKVWPTALPWEGIAEAAKRAAERAAGDKPDKRPRRRHPTAFGPNALAETLCRACFMYLGAYASPKQQSMSGYLRVVWTVAYLRKVSSYLRASLEKRQNLSSEAAEAAAPTALRRALEGLPESFWTEPAPIPEAMLLEAPTIFRPGLPKVETGSAWNKAKRQQYLSMASEASGGAAAANVTAAGPAGTGTPSEDARSAFRRVSRRTRNAGGAATQSSRSSEADMQTPSSASAPGSTTAQQHLQVQPPSRDQAKRFGMALSAAAQLSHFNAVTSARSPCVVDGECRLCQRPAGGPLWGNPRCRGCALTDVVSFKFHPLHRVLVSWPPGISLQPRVAAKPVQAERNALTPPPVVSANSLRPAPPGHGGAGSARKRASPLGSRG
mmetsp:Transcript_127420/g.321956  ORF Transcript_127420/g.321956 Transcript_127420/m.321956 type:complete len:1125 (+) Transcript_127420:134-3508(+)